MHAIVRGNNRNELLFLFLALLFVLYVFHLFVGMQQSRVVFY